jgi:hypothetical protein
MLLASDQTLPILGQIDGDVYFRTHGTDIVEGIFPRNMDVLNYEEFEIRNSKKGRKAVD